MRKLLLILLVALLVGGTIPAWAESELHLLWDIPFGISEEKFAELVFEKQGIIMDGYYSKDDQDISILGFPARLRCMWGQYYIDFFDVSSEDDSYNLKQLASIASAVSEKYGAFTGITVEHLGKKDGQWEVEGGGNGQAITQRLSIDPSEFAKAEYYLPNVLDIEQAFAYDESIIVKLFNGNILISSVLSKLSPKSRKAFTSTLEYHDSPQLQSEPYARKSFRSSGSVDADL